ncbi:MAG: hypothetical protein LBK06_08550 [Planctomycetaceae bacterium]|nr:hypothetical protein [Planctomycetaceae bacterium]
MKKYWGTCVIGWLAVILYSVHALRDLFVVLKKFTERNTVSAATRNVCSKANISRLCRLLESMLKPF